MSGTNLTIHVHAYMSPEDIVAKWPYESQGGMRVVVDIGDVAVIFDQASLAAMREALNKAEAMLGNGDVAR